MARNAGVAIENNFVNGLVTEATGLNFPENAVTATDNCVFDPIGKVYRRSGIDFEFDFDYFRESGSADGALVEYLWEAVGGDGDKNILVQQIGNLLYFFDIVEGDAVSDSLLWTFDLLSVDTDATLATMSPCDFAHGLGRLVVVNPGCDPFYITYDRDAETFSATPITISTRDFRGLDPHPTPRGNTLTTAEYYNRINQGWSTELLEEYKTKLTFYPSDYEVWWLYRGPEPMFDGAEIFLPVPIVNQVSANYINRGNSPAPQGSVILVEFNQDRGAATGLAGIPVVTSGVYRPSTCAFHTGRVFYSGVNWQEYSSKVYFTQIIEKPAQYGACHQENDPTSQYSPDLLPTDGGVISIPEAGSIYKLWSINNSILVFASNGVWEITGSSGIGFSATDYTAKKISSIRNISKYSFVSVVGTPMWWGADGIYVATPGEAMSFTVQNISDPKIKKFFLDIPEESRKYAKGVYNPKDQVVTWLFRSLPIAAPAQRHHYNRALNFNVSSKAFYPWSFESPEFFIKGVFPIRGINTVRDEDAIKFLVHTSSNQWTYAKLFDTVRLDWWGREGPNALKPYTSFFTTGYKLRGQGMSKAQTNYIRLFNEGPGEFVLYAKWDYNLDPLSGRWGSPQLVQFNDLSDKTTQTRRRKLRGHGLALQIHVENNGNADFDIVGWTTFDSANARP